METHSGNVHNTKKEETKVDDPAKLQLGATIGRDADFEPVALNPNIEIPKYDGTEDPRPWIESLEEIGFLYHWADYIIARYAAMNMTGSAKTWLNLHKASFTSWENIKIRLIQDFSLDANKEELRRKLNRMQHWNEPTIRFAEDILVLCNKVDSAMEEETKIEHVIGGLKKEYSFALYLNPPKTTDELLVVCKKMDSFEKKYRERVEKSRNLYNGPRYSRPQQQSRNVPPTATRNYQTTSRPQAPVYNNYKNDSPPTPRQYRNNFPQPSTPRRPYNPNFVPKPNLQRNTYNKSQEVSKNRTEDGRPICFKCNKPGHVARYCRVKFIRILEEDPTDTQEKVEEKCQMNGISDKSGPRLYADIGTFEALVDTGADLSVVDLRTALDTGHGISNLAKTCAGPDGKKLDMVGSIFLNIKIDDETLSHKFVILKTHLRTLILGRDFLKKMNAKIDCKQETIKYDLTNNHDESNFEMLKIKSAKDSIVPECSIKLIKALVETEDGEYIIEESSKMSQTNGLRLARSLINVINRETHIWITNPYPRPLKIMKNQTLAFGSSPAKINVSREREVEENEEPRFQVNENLSPKEQKELKQVLERYGNLFSSRLGRTNLAKHRIDTEDAKPIKHKPYQVSAKERDIIKEQIDEMLTKVKDVYPIPRIDEVMDTLLGSTYFSAIDLRSGYWQVEVEERDKEKTAFTTAHGLYEFNVMPFGLCNAPATFERNMENMLGNLRWQICLCYLDDVIIYSPDFPTHLKRLEAVFRCFRESNLRKARGSLPNPKNSTIRSTNFRSLNPNAPTYIHTDASNIGIGATLVQDINGEEKVISYLSRTLSKAEQNYSTTEKECLAVVWSMSKLRPYLYGRHFKIVTDHHALCWLKNLKDPTGRLARWALKIQEYDFDIIHKSGKKHLDADGLSRGPLPETDWDEDFERLFLNQITDEEDKFIESVKKNLNGSRRSIAQNFKEEDGCLFKKNPNPEGRAWLLVVPEKKKIEIMKEYHNHMSNGHLGVARTMYRIKSKYFWPSMLKDVSEFVKTCHLCQSRKGSNQLPSGLLQPIPPANFPFERIGIDFVCPLPSTKNRKKWIIVLTDYYTRYAETKAVSEATVKEVSKFLVKDIFLRHGAPQYLISDRGSQFTSNLMKEECRCNQSDVSTCGSAYPSTSSGGPKATCTAILQHVQDTLDHSISTRTISRRLVANGLHSCRPLRRLPLTPPNRRQRLEWCRARSTWMTEWHRVVFSDESRFCLSSDSRRVRVWRRRGERSNPAAIVERPTVRQRGIMVWGAIAYDSRSPLLRIQGTMTAQRYVDDVLRPVTLPYLQGVPNALYQQDNARPHTARISQQALQDVQMLPWPPYSPDLSPIEHVWDIIGRRLHALPQPRSEDELWQMVEREWRAIPQDAIRTLIDSLPRRVAACIAKMENSVQVPKFDGKNFASWKFRIVSILEGKELDDLLESDPPEDEVKFKEWKKKDAQAKGIITCAMTDSLVASILNCKTSKDIWIALHERYEGDKKKRIIEARNDVSRLTMRKEENWEEYLYRSEKLLEQARNLGAEIEDQEFTTSVIRGLPQKYNLVALQLNCQMKVSISDLKNCLKQYHERFTHEEKEGNAKAFNTIHKESFSNNKHFHKNRNGNKPICFICAKPGHKAIECWHNPKNKRGSENKQTSKNKLEHQNKAKFVNLQPEEHVSNIKENETTQQPEEWVIDSGASCHMTSNRDLLKEEREVHKTIKLADDSEIISNAEGAIEIEGQNKLIRLNDVLYVEKLSGNLMSVNKLVDGNKKVLFDKDGGHIMEEDGEEILMAQRINDFYIIKTSAPEEIPSQALKATLHTWNDWHKRLGHLNEEYMKQMLKNNSAHNFNTQSQNMDTCQVCIQAKHPRTPFKPVLYPQSTRPLDLIHIDLIGPIQEESIGGAKYVLTLVDDFSRKIFVEFLSSKLETFDIIRSFIEEIEKEKEIKVKQLRSDNGKEFTNNQMTQYLKGKGIKHQLTNVYTPQQNGISERYNRTLIEGTRALLIDSQLPLRYWAETMSTFAYLKNRTPCKKLGWVTPEERFSNRKPTVAHLKIFGCIAYYYVHKHKRGKFQPTAKAGIFVGYSSTRKAWRLIDPENENVIETRDVKFLENKLGKEILNKNDSDDTQKYFLYNFPEETIPETSEEVENHDDHSHSDLENQDEHSELPYNLRPNLKDKLYYELSSDDEPIEDNEDKDPTYDPTVGALKLSHGTLLPSSYEEAINHPDSPLWQQAMDKEIHSLQNHHVWDLTELPEGAKAIKSKWIFSKKMDPQTNQEIYKARLVALGCSQKYGTDYTETFSPVMKTDSFRTLLAYATMAGYEFHHFDVETAFLYGKLSETIYMTQPPGYQDDKKKTSVCILNQALYGLKQSGRVWYETFTEYLFEIGLTQLKSDKCVFTFRNGNSHLLLGLHVDDMIIINSNPEILHDIIQKIRIHFKIKESLTTCNILGIEIIKEDVRLILKQENNINKILQKYNMQDCKHISTPLDPNTNLDNFNSSKEVNKTQYQELIGSLLYLSTKSRPDIAFAVTLLSRYNQNPREMHMGAAKRILRYLKGSKQYGLIYTKGDVELKAYTDASWNCGRSNTARSTAGLTFYLDKNLISWS
ncbi:hypothetical protein LAZ67_17002614, partial [Cordylochernes scorpioides]